MMTLVRDALALRLNAYRVLLTRGREGTVIYVPPLASLDETYTYLTSSGFRELDLFDRAGQAARLDELVAQYRDRLEADVLAELPEVIRALAPVVELQLDGARLARSVEFDTRGRRERLALRDLSDAEVRSRLGVR